MSERGADRRQFMAVAGAAIVTMASGHAAQAAPSGPGVPRMTWPLPPAAGVAVRSYFGPIGVGAVVGACTIVRVHDVHLGAIPVVLQRASGERFQVDVLRRSPEHAGVGNTPAVSVFLTNRANGSDRTDEHEGLGAMALATVLEARERRGAVPPALLSHAERRAQHPDGLFTVLSG